MKSINELNISPWPWSYVYEKFVAPFSDHGSDYHYVNEANGSHVVSSFSCEDDENAKADARLMAAAPEMYEALEEAQRETCWRCHGSEVPRGDEGCEQCIVAGWIEALEKAGGAE